MTVVLHPQRQTEATTTSGDDYSVALFDQHKALLRASAISPEVARQRNYQSVDTAARLESIDIPKSQRRPTGLLNPVYGPECTNGEASTWQYRPDHPKVDAKGRPMKYVNAQRGMHLDVPPAVRPYIGDPSREIWITEGIRKADSAVSHGIDCIDVLGVDTWRGTNKLGGVVALPDWEYIALEGRDVFICFDSDVMVKENVQKALKRFAGFLRHRKAIVRLVMLPDLDDGKTGLDDYLASGGTVRDLEDEGRIIEPDELRKFVKDGAKAKEPPYVPPAPRTLGNVIATFGRHMHLDDIAPVLVTAATIVANRSQADPLWTLFVGPPSSGKTECLQAASGLPDVHSVGTITEAGLLSGTPDSEYDEGSQGGLLREIGNFGIISAKDFTSILSMNRDARALVLAALREIYDGAWTRRLGSAGGKHLHWVGKVGLIGCVTPAIDQHTAVMGALGERFILIRLDDVDAVEMAKQALLQLNIPAMRAELATAMAGLIEHANAGVMGRALADWERDRLVSHATYTARVRTPVIRDGYTREVIVLPQPEGTGRLVKQFRTLLGGLEAIGSPMTINWWLLQRFARGSAPALRMRLIDALVRGVIDPLTGKQTTPEMTTGQLAKAVGLAAKNVRNHLEDLTLLGLADRRIEEHANDEAAKDGKSDKGARQFTNIWRPSEWLTTNHLVDIGTKWTWFAPIPGTEMSPPTHLPPIERETMQDQQQRNEQRNDSFTALGVTPDTSVPGTPCANPTHTPKTDGGRWTCPDCNGVMS